jgi:hypothetical protein
MISFPTDNSCPRKTLIKSSPLAGRCCIETFEKWSILFKVKEDENFNHRNILNISRIKI